MKWVEVCISAAPAATADVEAKLIKCCIEGWEVIDLNEMRGFLYDNPMHWDYIDESLFENIPDYITIKFYVPDDAAGSETIDRVVAELDSLKSAIKRFDPGPLSVAIAKVDDGNWLDAWKEFFKPLEIGKSIVIRPAWEDYSNSEKTVIGIDPGHVFGTGQHETTRMCIEALERFMKPGSMMLDLGCGSGILSITGLKLGAEKCVAVDLNPDASGVMQKNATLNGISERDLLVSIGDVIHDGELQEWISANMYDCIAANIVTDAILSLLSIITESAWLKTKGIFIASGIIKERLEEVLSATKEAGLKVIETATSGEWACIVAER